MNVSVALAAILCWTGAGGLAKAEVLGDRTGTFSGVADTRINFRIVDDADGKGPGDKGMIVILPGYSESYLLYDEVIRDFRADGYGVAIMDHRGMGLSERLAPNTQVVHVERFADYVADASRFVDLVREAAADRPLFLVAHSTGGLIGAEVLAQRPEQFTAAVLSAPLFELRTGGLPEWLVYGVTRLAVTLGLERAYAPGNGDIPFGSYVFADNRTTTSVERFEAKRQVYAAHPEIFQSGPSNGWVAAAISATWAAAELAPRITTPLLVLQAGADDFVGPDPQGTFCKLAPACQLLAFAGARHELFREVDAVREPLLAAVLAHFATARSR